MNVLITTNNEHKVVEFKRAFETLNINVYSLKDINLSIDVEETGTTFKENALLKAQAVANLTDMVVIADDSGLEIASLGGFPGIYSARFMEGHPYREKFIVIFDKLKNIKDRTANFNCTLCVMNLKEEPLFFVGKAYGLILENFQGENGFGYDPIFYYPPLKKTFAEMTQDEKNSVSHRGNAIKLLVSYLKENL